MPDHATLLLILHWAKWAALAGGGLVLAYWACFVARRPRRYCPGQPRGRSAILWPMTWITHPRCGYDLQGLTEVDGVACCPECGRRSRVRERRGGAGAFAHLRVASVLLLAGVAVPTLLYLRSGAWAAHLPDTATLAIRATLGEYTPWCVRSRYLARARLYEYDDHYNRLPRPTPLWGWQQRWAVRLMIGELHSDDVRWNADKAIDLFNDYPREMTTPLLTAALNSDDYQQRQIAAAILRDWPSFVPTDDLLRVTVEGLRNDWGDDHGYSTYTGFNAHQGWEYLSRHGAEAEAHLAKGLESDDLQQRYLCAGLVAVTRRLSLLDRACAILIDGLGDDDVSNNAKLAVTSLMSLGEPALPYLEKAAEDDDAQRRQVALLMIRRIRTPGCPPMRILPSDAAAISELVLEPSMLAEHGNGEWMPDFPAFKRSSP